MSTISQRIASAFIVLFGKHGEVAKEARERGQSRQAVYREAAQVIDAVGHEAAQAKIAEKQHEFAAVSQAEGVSLSVARRQLAVVLPPRVRSVATLGRATQDAGAQAGALLAVIDEYARPKAQQLTADEIFLATNPS